MNILLTGATGFVGRHLLHRFAEKGWFTRAAVRRSTLDLPSAETLVTGDITSYPSWDQALAGIDIIVHAAGLAHAGADQDEALYHRINTQATLTLAQAAQRAGVRRFIFLSSIRAQTGPSSPDILTEDTPPHPTDAYGRSKLAAEQGLAVLDLDWVALRPVVIYGPGVKGNMATLLKLARLPVPLPFKSLNACRSLVSVEHVTSAIETLIAHPASLRCPVIVADPEPVTLPQMITALRKGFGQGSGLHPCPSSLLKVLTGRARYERLAGSMIAKPHTLMKMGWKPFASTSDQLRRWASCERDKN